MNTKIKKEKKKFRGCWRCVWRNVLKSYVCNISFKKFIARIYTVIKTEVMVRTQPDVRSAVKSNPFSKGTYGHTKPQKPG